MIAVFNSLGGLKKALAFGAAAWALSGTICLAEGGATTAVTATESHSQQPNSTGLDTSRDTQNHAQKKVVTTSPKHAVLAEPTRPVELPSMPGTNTGLTLHITSTEEDVVKEEAAALEAYKNKPPQPVEKTQSKREETPATNNQDFNFSENGWKPAPTNKKTSDDDYGDEPTPALRVRLPGLPDTRVTTPAKPELPSAQEQARAALIENFNKATEDKSKKEKTEKDKAEKDKKQTPEEAEACAAIKSYKEQQLDALKSDKQTLKALKEAISTLGYQKQLDYMSGSGDLLVAPAQANAKPPADKTTTK